MADVFTFGAQSESDTNKVGKGKPHDLRNSAKRARSHEIEEGILLRKPVAESFKSKLLSASKEILGMDLVLKTEKEKLIIEQGDISFLDGPNGPMMKLSEDLKLKLCKPWENALILKIMGRSRTLNFMISKLRQKWPLIVARFQMPDDLNFVLTEGTWVIANQYLVI
ncbi:hypothetical protein Ddye_018913 [Dipteronia dyeriana]|uniref:DUF4283 domain-containing protein n=1 Tax=Dipteronia dyeriana TaxID=168575 RepID=A0AAD9TXP9_9ROSI|nr:hypothetical protein Ddye_018913 [Dipteronia dyeriana]